MPKPNDLLAGLKFEKKNKPQPRLPPHTTIQRRPLNHPPIAAPYAGSSVQKVVYVSRSTPLMASVKRVKKLLSHVEKRAMQGVDVARGRDGMKRLAAASEALGTEGEEVVVRASGRAMEQALRVGAWFKGKEGELACRVVVRTGSVRVVDDLVEVEGEGDDGESAGGGEVGKGVAEGEDGEKDDVVMSGDDTEGETAGENVPQEEKPEGKEGANGRKRRRRGKRKRATYDKDDMPEARVRWISTVEVAISLKG